MTTIYSPHFRPISLTDAEMAALYRAGRTCFQISLEAHTSEATVMRRLRAVGVTMRPTGNRKGVRFRILSMTDAEIVEAYVEGFRTQLELAQQLDCTEARIKQILDAAGVKRRTRHDYRRMGKKTFEGIYRKTTAAA